MASREEILANIDADRAANPRKNTARRTVVATPEPAPSIVEAIFQQPDGSRWLFKTFEAP